MKKLREVGTEKIVVSIGLFAGFFVILSGILPEITGWERVYCTNEPSNPECVRVTREVLSAFVIDLQFLAVLTKDQELCARQIRQQGYN